MANNGGGLVTIALAPIENSEDHSAVQARCGDNTWTANLPSSIGDSSFEQRLKWLVERYARRDPFEGTAAAQVSKKLRRYGADLLDALRFQKALPPGAQGSHLLLEVHDTPAAPARFRTVHWEVLEDARLYAADRSKTISSIAVRRVLVSPSAQGHPDKSASSAGAEASEPSQHRLLRILAVTARKPD